MTKKEKLFNAFKENVGEWTCSYCNTGSNQTAAIFREIKADGYKFEKTGPKRWAKQLYCPICNDRRTHYKMTSTEPEYAQKHRCPMTEKDRERVLSLIGDRDAFSNSKITSGIQIDHKKPYARLTEDLKVSNLTDEEIVESFQSLTEDHNLLKARKCDECIISGIRPLGFGDIKYWYDGDEKYRGTCVGCCWYDAVKWREELNKHIKQ